jgi:hypothetical protein
MVEEQKEHTLPQAENAAMLKAQEKSAWCFLLVCLGFTVLTVAMTWPASPRLTDSLVGVGDNSFVFVWDFWWARKALVELHTNPYRTDILFHPQTYELGTHSFALGLGLISLPFQSFWDTATVHNAMLLLGVWGTGLATYYLLRVLGFSPVAAFFGGAVFTFSPTHLVHLHRSLNQIHVWTLPLALGLYIQWTRSSRAHFAVLAAMVWAFSFMITEYQTAFIGVAVLLWETCLYWSAEERIALPHVSRFAIVFLVTVLLMLPDLWLRRVSFESLGRINPFSRQFSVEPLSLITPAYFHPVFGPLVTKLTGGRGAWIEEGGFPWESIAYIGFSVLALTLYAFRKGTRKQTRPWMWTAAIFAIMSFGPVLHFMGNFGFELEGTPLSPLLKSFGPIYDLVGVEVPRIGIPLPYLILQRIPVLQGLRAPSRWFIGSMLAVSVLAACGATTLLREVRERLESHWTKSIERGFWAALLALVLFEFLVVPVPVASRELPADYEILLSDPGDYAIAVVPMNEQRLLAMSMGYQTLHEKRLIKAGVSFYDDKDLAFIHSSPLLSRLHDPETIVDPGEPVPLEDLIENDIRYVFVHQASLEAFALRRDVSSARIYEVLDTNLVRLDSTDDDILVYRIDD